MFMTSNIFFAVLQKRQILVTLVEILLPLLFSGILIVLRQKVAFKDYPNATIYESYYVDELPKPFLRSFQLAFVPSNSSVVRRVAEDVRGSLYLSSGERCPSFYTFCNLDTEGVTPFPCQLVGKRKHIIIIHVVVSGFFFFLQILNTLSATITPKNTDTFNFL